MFNEMLYSLGKLCQKGHDYEGTGKSLRLISNRCCIECSLEYSQTPRMKEYRKVRDKLPDVQNRTRTSHFKRKYGITMEKYKELYDAQKGNCAICESHKEILCVDHNHKDGKVRGLLCQKCNKGIGLLNDDEKILSKAIEYLNKI